MGNKIKNLKRNLKLIQIEEQDLQFKVDMTLPESPLRMKVVEDLLDNTQRQVQVLKEITELESKRGLLSFIFS